MKAISCVTLSVLCGIMLNQAIKDDKKSILKKDDKTWFRKNEHRPSLNHFNENLLNEHFNFTKKLNGIAYQNPEQPQSYATQNNLHAKLKITTEWAQKGTDFYFIEGATNGLDPGYDAMAIFNTPSAPSIYSYLVEQDNGIPMAIQALDKNACENVTIRLAVYAIAGEIITFALSQHNMPDETNIYLEDTVEETSILLNFNTYSITPNQSLNGDGRFYIKFIRNETLSNGTTDQNPLILSTNTSDKSIRINGVFTSPTKAIIYDLQGRLLKSHKLMSSKSIHSIDYYDLEQGMYLLQIKSLTHEELLKYY